MATFCVGGSSGLIGSALSAFLAAGGHEVRRLGRGEPDRGTLTGAHAVVNLGGAGIADGRWTRGRRRAIRESRVDGTRRLASALASLPVKPQVLLSASAVGIYGDRDDLRIDETAPPGSGFLAEVCHAWEAAAAPAVEAGIRTVFLRFGVVLAAKGGALPKMLPAFRAGLGGPIGGGRQGLSWIAQADAIRAIHFLSEASDVSGPVNIVAPQPVPQREFARTLGGVLRRPAVLPLPALAVRALFGRMGEEVLLWGCFAVPRRLEGAGFRFALPDLPGALRSTLDA